MKIIFKKSHLPFLKPTLKNGSGRDLWSLARIMQDENGLQHQLPVEIMLQFIYNICDRTMSKIKKVNIKVHLKN